MSIAKKSLISTLKTTKKANAVSSDVKRADLGTPKHAALTGTPKRADVKAPKRADVRR